VGPGTELGGVTSDGGGYILLGGRIIKVPPREPVRDIGEYLEVLSAIDASEATGEVRALAETEALRTLSIALTGRLKQQ
jgi:hypothetical protein